MKDTVWTGVVNDDWKSTSIDVSNFYTKTETDNAIKTAIAEAVSKL